MPAPRVRERQYGAAPILALGCGQGQAMTEAGAMTRGTISFGPFGLIARERLLVRGGAPVELGGRALDILIALVSRPNEVIRKRDLIAQVWPDVIVEEGSLRFHVAALRKALGDEIGRASCRERV